MARYISFSMIFPVIAIALLLIFFGYYWTLMASRRGRLDRSGTPPRSALAYPARRFPMARADAAPLLAVTLVYATTAFFQLGSTVNPQSAMDFSQGQTVEFSFDAPRRLDTIRFYSGLGTGSYNVEISSNGSHWSTLWARKDEEGKVTGWYWADAAGYDPSYALSQKYNDLFKWKDYETENPQDVLHMRITGKPDKALLELGELAFYDEDGALVTPSSLRLSGDAGTVSAAELALFDEQDTLPDKISWKNSAYFDEIYHARTALEHIEGVYPYEVSHPPLGKLILSLGIRLFGMTPFGWRFMGVLFGVLMLPILYVFLKNLFGKTAIAACGTALFAFDFMHLTQTRIATIDTYGVFFILCMYFFLYRFLSLPPDATFRQCALPLLLSGLCWGLGAASKWTVIYGGAGMAILYFIGLYFRWRDWPHGEGAPRFAPFCVKLILFSVLTFVLIPLVIYTLSYLPYAAAKGDTTLRGLVEATVENQKFMFNYHKGVTDSHPYESRWYQWIVDGRPILYYLDSADKSVKAAFGCFNNPAVCWGGLFAILTACVQMVRRRSGRALFIVVGYFSQLAPWFFIGRTTFEYHYFPSTLFLVLALAYVMDHLVDAAPQSWKTPVYGLTGGAVALYVFFYPVLVGLTVPRWYTTNFLQWLPSWPF